MSICKILIFSIFSLISAQNSLKCQICTETVNFFKEILISENFIEFYIILRVFPCFYQGFPHNYCIQISENQYKYEFLNTINSIFNPISVCFSLHFCKNPNTIPDLDNFYMNRILQATPPQNYFSHFRSESRKIRFLVFSDLHVDFEYQEVFLS